MYKKTFYELMENTQPVVTNPNQYIGANVGASVGANVGASVGTSAHTVVKGFGTTVSGLGANISRAGDIISFKAKEISENVETGIGNINNEVNKKPGQYIGGIIFSCILLLVTAILIGVLLTNDNFKSKYMWIVYPIVQASIFLLLTNLFALIYLILAKVSDKHFKGLNKDSDYIDSWYFSFSTFSTIGFGDIHPKSKAAKITVIAQIFLIIIDVMAVISLHKLST